MGTLRARAASGDARPDRHRTAILNGFGRQIGDAVIGLQALQVAQARGLVPPDPVLLRLPGLPPMVEAVHRAFGTEIRDLPWAAEAPGAAFADAVAFGRCVDLRDFAFDPDFLLLPMFDYFLRALGGDAAQVPPAERRNAWLARRTRPAPPPGLQGRILVCPRAANPMRAMPDAFHAALLDALLDFGPVATQGVVPERLAGRVAEAPQAATLEELCGQVAAARWVVLDRHRHGPPGRCDAEALPGLLPDPRPGAAGARLPALPPGAAGVRPAAAGIRTRRRRHRRRRGRLDAAGLARRAGRAARCRRAGLKAGPASFPTLRPATIPPAMRNLLQDADRDRLVAPLAGPLVRSLELGGARHRALAEGETSSFLDAEANARAAELLLLPGLRDAQPGLGDALLDFVMAMAEATVPARRAVASSLQVARDDPRNVEILTPFWRLSGDLSRGELRQELRRRRRRHPSHRQHGGVPRRPLLHLRRRGGLHRRAVGRAAAGRARAAFACQRDPWARRLARVARRPRPDG